MKSKLISILSFAIVSSAAPAATLTLANGNFQASGNNSDPANWTVTETNAGNISSVYIFAPASPAGTNVMAFWGAGATAQQSFPTAETTADSFSLYTVTFDSGWRGFNSPTATGFNVKFELLNVTDNTVLASATYAYPLPPASISNTYTVIATGNTVSLSYDASLPSLVGDTVALRLTATGFPNQAGSNFSNTGWVDNISVTAVPEPAAGLLGGLGLLGILRRRRA